MAPDAEAMHLLRDVTRTFARVQRKVFNCCGPATETQCLVLTTLSPGESISVSELAGRLATDIPWVSRTVEQLRRSADVQRLVDPADRRVVLVQLTPQGVRRAQMLQNSLDLHADAILGQIPEARRQSVFEALRLLQRALVEVETTTPTLPGTE